MKILFVVAHPDDEALGAGAFIHKISRQHKIGVVYMCSNVEQRSLRENDVIFLKQIEKSNNILNINSVFKGDFPNIAMNTVPDFKKVAFIEKCIQNFHPDIIFTHHPGDLNTDHVETSKACQTAIRYYQRNGNENSIKELYFMEVLSSTEWNLGQNTPIFNPNTFFEVSKEDMDSKLESLNAYGDVLRESPHPRSPESIFALAKYRGTQAQFKLAEAFQLVFKRYEIL